MGTPRLVRAAIRPSKEEGAVVPTMLPDFKIYIFRVHVRVVLSLDSLK